MSDLQKSAVIKDTNYFIVAGWMVNRLKLSGNELSVYAIIYGFSQTEDQEFTGSAQYLADFCGISRRSISSILAKLTEAGHLVKREEIVNGVKLCRYRAANFIGYEESSHGMKNLHRGYEISSQGVGSFFTGGYEESSHNNKEYIIKDNKEDIKDTLSGSTLSEARDAVPSTADRTPYTKVMKLYNSICTSFPSIKVLSNDRKNHIKARFAQGYTLNDFRDVFNNVESSKWLKTWKGCDFDWIITDRSFPKILEGKYRDRDDNDSVSHNASDPVRIDFQRYRDADGEFSVSFETLGNGRKKMTMSYDSGLTKVLEYDNDTRPTWLQ